MRFIICFLLVFFAVSGCKKKIAAEKEDLLLNLIVSDQWVVARYTRGIMNVTADFAPYSFQFRKDFTIDAINNGAVETTGTWNGSIDTKTVTANFTTSNAILLLLNGDWHVTDSGLDYVEAAQKQGSEDRYLRLAKK